jgi:hypothetical protein
MPDRLDQLTNTVLRKLSGVSPVPSRPVLRHLLETVFLATLRTEEGKPIRGAITFANSTNPDPDAPPKLRAHYPMFTAFEHPIDFNVNSLVKLSRAVDSWAGAIAVDGSSRHKIVMWGVLDQLVHSNIRLHHEGGSGIRPPGVLSIHMDGIAALSVYRGNLLLARLQQDRLIRHENDALNSQILRERIASEFEPKARQIALAIDDESEYSTSDRIQGRLVRAWSSTVSRLCIGLRRLQTGGAFLFTPKPLQDLLSIKNPLPYDRLSQATILNVLDSAYKIASSAKLRRTKTDAIPSKLVFDESLADTDSRNREMELAGAVRLVTSLASVDGLVLMTPSLVLRGFGVKIRSDATLPKVYNGPGFSRRGTKAKTVDLAEFGTRHNSMLQYCSADPNAVGIVVSQDGNVRVIMRVGSHLTFWDDVKLLQYSSDYQEYLESERFLRQSRQERHSGRRRGYTPMPKTIDELMALKATDKEKEMVPDGQEGSASNSHGY